MWFLPVLIVGAIAMAIARRVPAKPPLQLPPGVPAPGPARPMLPNKPGAPGPIAVLGEILRIGQSPPPTVLICAIAEAQSLGRDDLASDIARTFIEPVVRDAQRRGMNPNYQRGSCSMSFSCAPRQTADRTYSPMPSMSSPPPSVQPSTSSSAVAAPPAAMPPLDPSMTSMDDEISALLNSDPTRFMDMISKNAFQVPMQQAQPPQQPPQAPATAPSQAPTEAPAQVSIGQSIDLPPTSVQAPQYQPAQPYRQQTFVPGSPFSGISDSAWIDFTNRLARESPQFESSRHVGQYRQRRERLAELGINPAAIVNLPDAQRSAVDADLVDAHHHGVESGLFEQHLSRPISVPGRDQPEMISLSGLLGVIQCAGLEGAVGWLERPMDRKRYPHTTQAFLTTNGVF
jgi:hypothetical protein